jgi:hypothetical protein
MGALGFILVTLLGRIPGLLAWLAAYAAAVYATGVVGLCAVSPYGLCVMRFSYNPPAWEWAAVLGLCAAASALGRRTGGQRPGQGTGPRRMAQGAKARVGQVE